MKPKKSDSNPKQKGKLTKKLPVLNPHAAGIDIGAEHHWVSVSPDDPDGTELLLEPNGNPATQAFQKAIFGQGIPATAFAVEDVQKEYERMKEMSVVFHVVFHTEPTQMGEAVVAVLDDTCDNLIQLYQVKILSLLQTRTVFARS